MDFEAMLNEALTLINALQQRVLYLAGQNGALKKELQALKEKDVK